MAKETMRRQRCDNLELKTSYYYNAAPKGTYPSDDIFADLPCPGTFDGILQSAVALLSSGGILAIKGIGGFHLAVDAHNEMAVERLRKRKHRDGKPFGVMLASMSQVESLCQVGAEERRALEDPRAPMVLLKRKPAASTLAYEISPHLNTLGILLPYTFLHRELSERFGYPLVMTSGNISDEPLCRDLGEAVASLRNVADGYLFHDDAIENRMDDSVMFYCAGEMRMVRRARGYAPRPLNLKENFKPIVAAGALTKNTFCILEGERAVVSHHIGDLTDARTHAYYLEEIEKYSEKYGMDSCHTVGDMHPGYPQYRHSQDKVLTHTRVQHHHAHIASAMAEYGIDNRVLGIVYDGSGWGTDGCIWGSEFLLADLSGFARLGHLSYFPLPGGDLAIRSPYRAALGIIYPDVDGFASYVSRLDPHQVRTILHQIRSNTNTVLTSSMGRLFDAVASLLGMRDVAEYEGQAAMELESAIEPTGDYYSCDVHRDGGMSLIDVKTLLRQISEDCYRGVSVGCVSAKFHNSVIRFTSDLAVNIRDSFKVNEVVLTGGCFQNRYLLGGIDMSLKKCGFNVLIPKEYPVNDGGISLGQAVIAGVRLERA